jgi:hypothetical protein
MSLVRSVASETPSVAVVMLVFPLVKAFAAFVRSFVAAILV